MEVAWHNELAKTVSAVKGPKEARELLQALLTPAELEESARRWQIVKRLAAGQSQRRIRDELGIAIATVTRGSKEMQNGNGIFQKLLKRLSKKSS